MKFSYKKIAPGIIRPIIPIELIHKDISVPYEVLVDSGADFCDLMQKLPKFFIYQLQKERKPNFRVLPATKQLCMCIQLQ